jgi:hypothetical protein
VARRRRCGRDRAVGSVAQRHPERGDRKGGEAQSGEQARGFRHGDFPGRTSAATAGVPGRDGPARSPDAIARRDDSAAPEPTGPVQAREREIRPAGTAVPRGRLRESVDSRGDPHDRREFEGSSPDSPETSAERLRPPLLDRFGLDRFGLDRVGLDRFGLRKKKPAERLAPDSLPLRGRASHVPPLGTRWCRGSPASFQEFERSARCGGFVLRSVLIAGTRAMRCARHSPSA